MLHTFKNSVVFIHNLLIQRRIAHHIDHIHDHECGNDHADDAGDQSDNRHCVHTALFSGKNCGDDGCNRAGQADIETDTAAQADQSCHQRSDRQSVCRLSGRVSVTIISAITVTAIISLLVASGLPGLRIPFFRLSFAIEQIVIIHILYHPVFTSCHKILSGF